MAETIVENGITYTIMKNGVKRIKANGGWGSRRLSARNVGYKVCQICKKEKQLSEFFKKGGPTNQSEHPRSYCKPCLKEASSKKHQKKVREDEAYYQGLADRRKRTKLRNKQFIEQYLEGKSCVDCGFNHPDALHFDHVRGFKLANVSALVHRDHSLKLIKEEIEKCEIRCANCHFIRTKKDQHKGLHWDRRKPAILGE